MAASLDRLALIYQEVITVIVRLRVQRQSVSNAHGFRTQVLTALRAAETEAARRGYAPEDARLATFAVVAFLDESILNSQNPAFNEWLRKPLQEELFGVHVAGQIFFENVDRLLIRHDSQQLADVLEVYETCLLLGFRGKYGVGGAANTRMVVETVSERIRRIRGGDTRPRWRIPEEAPRPPASDPWARRFLWTAAACVALALAAWAGFSWSLGSAVSRAEAVAARARL